jgi:peptide/nickel transport system permease protein
LTGFAVRRLLRALVSLVLFQAILFVLIKSIPQDFFTLEFGSGEFGEIMQDVRGVEPGPVWQEFLGWLGGFFQGDLGASYANPSETVADMLLRLLPRTLLLLLPGTLIGFFLGMWLGKLIAWKRGGWLELGATLGGTAFYTSFAPFLAFVLINVFALSLGWLPPEKMIDLNKWLEAPATVDQVVIRLLQTALVGILLYLLFARLSRRLPEPRALFRALFGVGLLVAAVVGWLASGWAPLALDILQHLALPLVTLILLSFGETMLAMKTTMLEVLGEDHVPAAHSRGLPDAVVRDRYVARLALLPVLTRFVVYLPFVLIGSFVLERIFAWEGIGVALVEAADAYDLPVLMGTLSIAGVGILIAHLGVDLLNAWLDPRLRAPRPAEAA